MTRMPALFIGHGSPMNTLELNGFTRAWRQLGTLLPEPRAILVVSAHWYIGATAVTAMPRPRTIHDFFGFPQPLFEFDYPAVGSAEIALEIAEAVKPDIAGLDLEWGLDHGTWSVLAHLYPRANIPVLQLSINASQSFEYHFALGTRLAALRESGVLLLSSGNVVHNLRLVDWHKPTGGADWARRFDEAVVKQMTEDPSAILRLSEHPDYRKSVPTPDHYLPLLYTAGIAALEGRSQALIQGYSLESISMTSYNIGLPLDLPYAAEASAEQPTVVPADQTNM